MTTVLYDHNSRPITKSEIEDFTRNNVSPRSAGYVTSMFGGPHPFMDRLDTGNEYAGLSSTRDLMSTFIRPRDISSGDEYADYATTITNTSGTYNDRFAKRNPISDLNKPRDIAGVMSMSMKYYEDNYIVNRAVKIKKNFATREMTLLGPDSAKTFYEKEFRRLHIRQWLGHIFRYYWVVGRVVVYWGTERPIEGLCLLDPRQIIVRTFLNKKYVYLRPDLRWVSIMANGGTTNSKEFQFLQKNLPAYWIPYIIKNEEIPLKEESFALIENDLSLFSVRGIADYTIGGVPLSAAFDALQTSKMLMSGDFSTAWLLKNFIALVSIGDPKNEKDYSPPDQIALQKLASAFVRPEYAMMAFVDPTVQFRYITPDPELLEGKKYTEFNKQIEYVLGVPGVFTGAAGDYASASLSLKPFREDIRNGRLDVSEMFLDKLMLHMMGGHTSKKTGGKNANEEVTVEFDEDCLKDDKIIQEELNGKWDRGAISNRSLLEGKSRDFDTELQRKTDEMPHREVLQPLFDVAHGDPDQQGGGRPSSGGKPTAESGSGTPTPRPSRAR